MSDNKSEHISKPLLYIVQPKIPDPMQSPVQAVYRTKKRVSSNQVKKEEQILTKEEQEQLRIEAEDRQFDQVKQKSGVYQALEEVHAELLAVRKIQDQFPSNDSVVSRSPSVSTKQEESPEYLDMRKNISQVIELDPKPECEAKIDGQLIRFVVLDLEDKFIKIQVGSHIQAVPILDLLEFRVL